MSESKRKHASPYEWTPAKEEELKHWVKILPQSKIGAKIGVPQAAMKLKLRKCRKRVF
jgi:hypothetical protein